MDTRRIAPPIVPLAGWLCGIYGGCFATADGQRIYSQTKSAPFTNTICDRTGKPVEKGRYICQAGNRWAISSIHAYLQIRPSRPRRGHAMVAGVQARFGERSPRNVDNGVRRAPDGSKRGETEARAGSEGGITNARSRGEDEVLEVSASGFRIPIPATSKTAISSCLRWMRNRTQMEA